MAEPRDTTAESTIGGWLARLAAPAPDPGGGAAAAVVLAAGAALVSMSAGYAGPGPVRATAEAAAAAVGRRALAAADEDAAHSAALAEAFHLPDDSPERAPLMRERMLAAGASSRDIAELARDLLEPLVAVAGAVPPLLGADVAVAARMLAAAVRASAVNLRSNTTSARDSGAAPDELAPLAEAEGRAVALAEDFDALAASTTARL